MFRKFREWLGGILLVLGLYILDDIGDDGVKKGAPDDVQ
jgi:hypothetical protein